MTVRRTTTRHFLLVILCAMASMAKASESQIIMPKDLVNLAAEYGCVMVQDFYERPGMVGPPFTYGVVPGDASSSVAFWCERDTPGDQLYLLIVKSKAVDPTRSCPPIIEWHNFPGGLSVEVRSGIDLERFRFVSNPATSGPVKHIADPRLIVSYYDGHSEAFYCHDGKWLFTTTD